MKKFINQEDMKQVNGKDVFSLIRKNEQMTRREIERETGLSWGAVSNITSRLMEQGFVVENKHLEPAGPGRTPAYLEVDGSRFGVLGIDVNITGLHAELINLKNERLMQLEHETDYTDAVALQKSIFDFLDRIFAREEVREREILGIGVAMQGVVDANRGISIRLSQCPGWEQMPLADMIKEKTGIETWIDHDPNCILYAYQMAHELENAILLRIDRGIGMAVMLDGKILDGIGRFEIAHTIAVPNGALCTCGKRGCLEAYASVNGLERASGQKIEELAISAKEGCHESQMLFADMAEKLGQSIYNIQKIFHVSEIILCGELMKYEDLFIEQLLKENFWVRFQSTEVSSAAYGAAMAAIKKVM